MPETVATPHCAVLNKAENLTLQWLALALTPGLGPGKSPATGRVLWQRASLICCVVD